MNCVSFLSDVYMIYSENTWYRFRANNVNDEYRNIIDGYIITGVVDSAQRAVEVRAIYDKDDLRANILVTSSKCRNLISTSNGSLLDVGFGSIKLSGGKNNLSTASRAKYYADNTLDEFVLDSVVYSIQLLSPVPEIATRLQNILSRTNLQPSPYLFLSAGCSVDVNERTVDFSQSKSIVFGNNVDVIFNDGTSSADVFNYLYMRTNSLERANSKLQTQLSNLQSRFDALVQQIAPA